MDSHKNYPYNYYGYDYAKGDGKYKENSFGQKEPSGKKNDEDLVIEDNTIYEIDRECMERLKRNKKRLI